MNRTTLTPACHLRLAVTALVLIWAGIYLPALGSLELKGEEGRRAQPGMTMLDTGDWLVPEIGGEDYFRKPPLVNWAAAASVALTGAKNEWSVRLPSVLAVLALGLGILLGLRAWLGLAGSLMAALIALTNISLMEKGRLIEIEAMYIALTGLALVSWWRFRLAGHPTPAWILAGVFLGLGMLAKGPPHLLFFYVTVAATAHGTGDGWRAVARELLGWRQWLGLAITLGVFALWAIPLMAAADTAGDGGAAATGTWSQQLLARLAPEGFKLWTWWENLFRSALINFLPWSALFPLVWHRPLVEAMPADRARLFRALRSGLVAGWIVVAALPGSAPRYTLPLLTLASVVVAIALAEWARSRQPAWLLTAWRGSLYPILALTGLAGLALPFLSGFSPPVILSGMAVAFGAAAAFVLARRLVHPVSLLLVSATAMVGITAVYSLGAVPRMMARDTLAASAARVASSLPDGETLFFFRPDYQPLIFYLPRPLERPTSSSRIEDDDVRFLLVRGKHLDQVRARRGWADSAAILELQDLSGKPLYLLDRSPSRPERAP